ncbi:glycosyltransferase family 4 protein, partial [Candidatus Saccharibacteria bacterium]|nr:glycosyltransferase family 4 protein [Candidatus Saccharibacteria bacterium]
MSENRKLKVGLVFDDSLDSTDGVAQYVKTLGSWLSGQGHAVCYLVGQTKLESWQGGRVYSLAKNQTVYFNGNKLSIPLPANQKRLKRVLGVEKFDVLHVMMPHSPFLAQRIIKHASSQTTVVGTFHIFPASKLAELGGRVLRLAYFNNLRRFDAVVSVSPVAQNYARKTFRIESQVVPNPVDVARFAKKNSNFINGRVVFLGRLVQRKGCNQLLKAFALLSKDPFP